MNNIIVIAKGVLRELIRRKDIYLIFTLLVIMITYAASLSFGGERNFDRYFKEIGISLAYIFSMIIAVTFASRQIPQEVEAKTIYPILAHPVSRQQFIVGKFAGVLFISTVSFSLFYITFIVSLFLKGAVLTPPVLLAEGYILHILLLSFFTALAVLLSLFFSTTANTWISIIIYFSTNWLGVNIPAYIYLPHPELFDIRQRIIHSLDVVPLWAVSFLAVYAVLYTALFLLLASLVFRRRNL